MAQQLEFHLGLVMAGAVSAGAYSAGVVDFLTEALDEYETCRTTGRTSDGKPWDGPVHAVRMPVIAGASAGGMTAAMAALQLFRDFEHVRPDRDVPKADANRLYASWVDEIDITYLLRTSDIGGGRPLKSLLCSDELERIVKRTIDGQHEVKRRPWLGRRDSQVLTLLLTVSNVGGVPYAFKVRGGGAPGQDDYGMLNHGDDMRFAIGAGGFGSGAGFEGYQIVDVARRDDVAFGRLGVAALATGAFPIGFAARTLRRERGDYWLGDRVGYDQLLDGELMFRPVHPTGETKTGPFEFNAVDGGTIDNEPFELARRFLHGKPSANPDNRHGNATQYAVLLVDPFPNTAAWPTVPGPDKLTAMLRPLVGMLIDQARFKPQELSLAFDNTVFSRFAIMPEPVDPDAPAGELTIASGAIAGFSGFLHHSYRRHDYLLGMRNAQAFLRWHLNLPEDNPLFDAWKQGGGNAAAWYVRPAPDRGSSVAAGADRAREPIRVASRVGEEETTKALPIIPLTERLQIPIEIGRTDMPRHGDLDVAALEQLINDRMKAVTAVLVDNDLKEYVPGYGWGGGQIAKMVIPPKLTKGAMKAVEEAQAAIKRAFP